MSVGVHYTLPSLSIYCTTSNVAIMVNHSDPINIFHGGNKTENEPIRLSYQRGSHYNSIVDPHKATIGVGLGLPNYVPGGADKNLIKDAVRQSEDLQIEQVMYSIVTIYFTVRRILA